MNPTLRALLPLALAGLVSGCGGGLQIADHRPAPVEERVTPPKGAAPTRVASIGAASGAPRQAPAEPSARVLAAPDGGAAAPSSLPPPSALPNEPTPLPPPSNPTHTTAGSDNLVAGEVTAPAQPASTTQVARAEQLQSAAVPERTAAPAAPARPSVSGVVPEPPASPAARELVSRGQAFAQRGEFEQAAATYERALEIAPADPWLWHRLASVRSAQGQTGLARALARRSNALGGGDPAVEQANASML